MYFGSMKEYLSKIIPRFGGRFTDQRGEFIILDGIGKHIGAAGMYRCR